MRPLRSYEALLTNNPLLRLALPLAAGIALADWWYNFFSAYFFCIAGGVVVAAVALYYFRKPPVFNTCLYLCLGLVGALLLVNERRELVVDWPEQELGFRAVLVSEPRVGERSVQVVAQVSGGRYDGRHIRLGLMLPPDDSTRNALPSLRPGDAVLCNARIEQPHNTGNPGEFDYATWLRRQHIVGTAFCFSGNWRLSDYSSPLPFSVRALRWRSYLVDKYESYFQGRPLAVFSAMTLGDDSRLDTSTREIYSRTGVSHVLALSGLHLTILFSFYQILVLAHCRRRWLYAVLSVGGLCGLWAYAFLAGMPLSLLRSAVMFTVMQLAACFRHDSFSLNNLALAALVLLFFSPQSLFDVGFQLSCLSVFFILVFVPAIPMPDWVCRFKVLRQLHSLLVVSVCAQLGTAPLVAYYFHTFPVYSLLANVVAVPLSYALLLLGLLFFMFPWIQGLWADLAGWVMGFMDNCLTALSLLPGAVLTLYPTLLAVFGCYLFLWLFISWRVRRRRVFYWGAGAVLLLAGLHEAYAHRSGRLSRQLVFYNLYGASAVHAIHSADSSYLWTSGLRADTALAYVRRNFWKEEGVKEPVRLEAPLRRPDVYYESGILSFSGCRVALLSQPLRGTEPPHPLAVDYMLLARGYTSGLRRALSEFSPRLIVLDGSLTDYYRTRYTEEAKKIGIPVYDMRVSGALILVLDE